MAKKGCPSGVVPVSYTFSIVGAHDFLFVDHALSSWIDIPRPRVRIESVLGSGNRFAFCLPATAATPNAHRRPEGRRWTFPPLLNDDNHRVRHAEAARVPGPCILDKGL
jgi:hypothetical protein